MFYGLTSEQYYIQLYKHFQFTIKILHKMSDNDDDNDDNDQQSIEQPSKISKPSSISYFWTTYANKLKFLQSQFKILPDYNNKYDPKITYKITKDTLSWNSFQKNNFKIKLENGKTKLGISMIDNTNSRQLPINENGKQQSLKQNRPNNNSNPSNQPKNIDVSFSTVYKKLKFTTQINNKYQVNFKLNNTTNLIQNILKAHIQYMLQYKKQKNITHKFFIELYWNLGLKKWIKNIQNNNKFSQIKQIQSKNQKKKSFHKNQLLLKTKITNQKDCQIKLNSKDHFGYITSNPSPQQSQTLQVKTATQLKLLYTNKQKYPYTIKSYFHFQLSPIKQLFKFQISCNFFKSYLCQLQYACKYWNQFVVGAMIGWDLNTNVFYHIKKWELLLEKQRLLNNKDNISLSISNNSAGIKYKNKLSSAVKVELTLLQKLFTGNNNIWPNFGIKIKFNS